MANKKGNKKRYKRKQKGDKADTVTNKKGDKNENKKGDKRKQKGDKADTVTHKKGHKGKQSSKRTGRQAGRHFNFNGCRNCSLGPCVQTYVAKLPETSKETR